MLHLYARHAGTVIAGLLVLIVPLVALAVAG